MHSLPLIAVVLLGMSYGLAWHNKPAREPVLARRATSHLFWKSEENSERRATEPRAFVPRSNKSSHPNWDLLAIWSRVVISFAALFFAGYVIWAKCLNRDLLAIWSFVVISFTALFVAAYVIWAKCHGG